MQKERRPILNYAEGFEEGYKQFKFVGIPEDARRIMPDMLRDFTTDVLRKVHLPADDAALVARYLVDVDLRGVVSHGTRQLRRYVAEFREGRINPRPEIAQIMDAPSMAIFDGDGGTGYLVATRATEAVIEKAKANGIAVVCTRNHGHVGSVGIYARLALACDLATFSVAGGVAWEKPTQPDATVWDAMGAPADVFWHSNGRRPAVCAGYECEHVEGPQQTRRGVADISRLCF